MAIELYKTKSNRRVFTNQPFRRGMLYEDVTVTENISKTLVNLDISSSGDYAYPRPAFVNAVMDNYYQTLRKFPVNILQQSTSLGRTFLLGFERTVSEEDFLNDTVATGGSLYRSFGIDIIRNSFDFEEKERRDGIFEIVDVEDVYDGDTYKVVILNEDNEEETVTVRLLGIDTPETYPETEPYGDVAASYANDLMAKDTFGDYKILRRFLQYEPATASTDRGYDRVLGYVLLEIENTQDADAAIEIHTLTEMLLYAGLGEAQFDKEYIYYDRFKSADSHARDEELGIHRSVEDIPEDEEGLPRLDTPLINEGADPEIVYDEESVEFKTSITIKNTNDVSVYYYGEIGSLLRSGLLNAGESVTLDEKVLHSTDYPVKFTFVPEGSGDYNASEPYETEIPGVFLDLDENTINDPDAEYSAPFEVGLVKKFGFEYDISNHMVYPLDILIKHDKETMLQERLEDGDVRSDEYTNEEWPLYENHIKNISIRYSTISELGLIRSLWITVPVEIPGFKPVIEYVSQDVDHAEFRVINDNVYAADVYFLVNGDMRQSGFTVSAESDTIIDLEGLNLDTYYEITAIFQDADVPGKMSDESNSESFTLRRLDASAITNVDVGTDTISFDLYHDNEENVDMYAELYDSSNTLQSTAEKLSAEPDVYEAVEFTGLSEEETYTIKLYCNTRTKNYSDSTVDDSHSYTTNKTQYTVEFDSAGGTSVDDMIVDENTSIEEPSDPTRNGYEFDYWMTDSGTEVDFPYQVTKNTTMTAHWTKLHDVSVYDGEGTKLETLTVRHGSELEEADIVQPDKSGYVFDGWEDSNQNSITFPYTVNSSVSFYASWIEEHTVQFETGEGSSIDSVIVLNGETVTEPGDPERADYRFGGWYTGSSYNTEFDFDEPITNDTTVYAKWVLQVEVEFRYIGDGTEENPDYQKIYGPQDVDASFRAPTEEPTELGEDFQHWSDGTVSLDPGEEFTVSEDTLFTAVFENAPQMETPDISVYFSDNINVTWRIANNSNDTAELMVRTKEGDDTWSSWYKLDNDTFEKDEYGDVSFENIDYGKHIQIEAYAVDPTDHRPDSQTASDDYDSIEQTEKPTVSVDEDSVTGQKVSFTIINEDGDNADVSWSIYDQETGGTEIASGSISLSANGDIDAVGQVSAENLDYESTYWLRDVVAKSTGKADSESATVISATTDEPPQMSTPTTGVDNGYTTSTDIKFLLANGDSSRAAKVYYKVLDVAADSYIEESHHLFESGDGQISLTFSDLDAETEYRLEKVYAEDPDGVRTDSEYATERTITTGDYTYTPTPDVVVDTDYTTSGSIRFEIRNNDPDHSVDLEYVVRREDSDSGTIVDSGTGSASAGRKWEVTVDNLEPSTKYYIVGVYASSSVYDKESEEASRKSETTNSLEKPSMALHSDTSGSSMGRGARHFNFVLTNTTDNTMTLRFASDSLFSEDLEEFDNVAPGESVEHYVTVTYIDNDYTWYLDGTYTKEDGTIIFTPVESKTYTTRRPLSVDIYSKSTDYINVEVLNNDYASCGVAGSMKNVDSTYSPLRDIEDFTSNLGLAAYRTESAGDNENYIHFDNLNEDTKYSFRFRSSVDNYNREEHITATTHSDSGGGGGCLHVDTPIIMANGASKVLRDIRVGDLIRGYYINGMPDESEEGWEDWNTDDVNGGYYKHVKVVKHIYSSYTSYYVLNNDIKITQQHRIFARKQNEDLWGWYDVRDLGVGDYLLGLNNKPIAIDFREYVDEPISVIEMDTESIDTYFAGNTPVVVHNSDVIKE